MASAILPSRYDSRSSDFMSKFSNKSNLNCTRLRNFPKPNPNPRFNSTDFVIGKQNHQHLSSSPSPEAAFLSSSLNSVPANSNGYRYITFRLGSYTKRELKALRKRLILDLERVRSFRQSFCSGSKSNYHAPQLMLPLPTVPEVNDRHKSVIGQKRTKALPAVRDAKKQCGRMTNVQKRKLMMRECVQILGKLMKHKHGWVFNTPVDAVAMKLYDYHKIITKPMDLGTIKAKLAKNEYESPLAFASDVRLTFENAMLYNGKGSEVFVMAECLLLLFENMFDSTHQNEKLIVNQSKKQTRVPSATIVVETPSISQQTDVNCGNKPVMTEDQKAELAARMWNLQLAPEERDQIMGIVKKGVGFAHTGNEIELDLEVLDDETLWDLHSFINRTRGKEGAAKCVQTDHCPASAGAVEDDVDIDIGEEMEPTSYPLVEIEKDAVIVSSSDTSSDTADSSSSDSGSSSCSGNSYNEQEVNSTPRER